MSKGINVYGSALSALLFLYSATASAQGFGEKNNFTLSGTVKGLEGKYLYLGYRGWSKEREWDSTKIVHGRFHFSGHIEPQWKCFLTAKADKNTSADANLTIPLYMTPGNMTINLTADKFYEGAMQGSEINDEYLVLERQRLPFLKKMQPLNNAYDSLNELTDNITDSAQLVTLENQKAAVLKQADSLYQNIVLLNSAFISTHPESVVAVCVLEETKTDYNFSALEKMYGDLSPVNRFSPWGTRVADELGKRKFTAKGAQARRFIAQTVSGDTINLDSCKGKYVLLDFWASWSASCMQELPALKEMYTHFKDKDIMFIGISEDRDEQIWKTAVLKEGIEWPNIRSQPGVNDISKLYGISSFPTILIIDKEGKILENFSSGPQDKDQLTAALTKYLQ